MTETKREFWLSLYVSGIGVVYNTKSQSKSHSGDELVHVIEYSAFSSLETKLQRTIEFVKDSGCDYDWKNSGSLPQGQPIHRDDCRRCELIKELES